MPRFFVICEGECAMKKIFILLVLVMVSFLLSAEEAQKSERFYFFYSDSCPHCHEAMPFVEELEKEFPNIEFEKLELSKAPENMAIFNKKVEKLGIKGGGVPTFIFRDQYIVGFKKGVFEEKIRAMINKPAEKALSDKNEKPKKEAVPATVEKPKKEAAPSVVK